MKSLSKPKDKWAPFLSLKHATVPVPAPNTTDQAVIGVPVIFTDREIAFKKGEAVTLLRFSARVILFRRMVDEEGIAAWTSPMELPQQNWRMN